MLRRVAMCLVLALLVSGCGTMKAYEGPELPKSEIAVLDRSHSHGIVLALSPLWLALPTFKHLSFVYEIDGKPTTDYFIHLLPGEHTARVDYTRRPDVTLCSDKDCISNYETRDLSIDFTAKAGHEYHIQAERRGERNWIWVEDEKSGKVVAGAKPPGDNYSGKVVAGQPPMTADKLQPYASKGDAKAQYQLANIHLHEGRLLQGWSLMCTAANQEHGGAQYILGYFYEGRGAIRWRTSNQPFPIKANRVLSHMWYSLAASKGIKEAASYRDGLTERMTPTQIAEAEKLAKAWKPNPKACSNS